MLLFLLDSKLSHNRRMFNILKVRYQNQTTKNNSIKCNFVITSNLLSDGSVSVASSLKIKYKKL